MQFRIRRGCLFLAKRSLLMMPGTVHITTMAPGVIATTTVRYRVGTAGGRVAKKRPLDEAAMLERVAEILADHPGSWQIRRRGESEWSGARGRPATTERLADLIDRGDVGEAWQFRPVVAPAALYVVRKIEPAPRADPALGGDAGHR
jgi:hypothetical protein